MPIISEYTDTLLEEYLRCIFTCTYHHYASGQNTIVLMRDQSSIYNLWYTGVTFCKAFQLDGYFVTVPGTRGVTRLEQVIRRTFKEQDEKGSFYCKPLIEEEDRAEFVEHYLFKHKLNVLHQLVTS